MCPTLAVTNGMKPALTMAGATAFVLICANVITSLIRRLLKPHLRILVFTLTIADVRDHRRPLPGGLHAYDMSKTLGPYVPLIIVNCIIIAAARSAPPSRGCGRRSADAVGKSIGFALGLGTIATVREILGIGTWFGLPVLPEAVGRDWVIMVLPPGAFITLGLSARARSTGSSTARGEAPGGARRRGRDGGGLSMETSPTSCSSPSARR